MTGFNDGPGTRTYTYDDFNRLKAATEIPDPTPNPDFEYDRYGNRYRQGTQTLSYDNTNLTSLDTFRIAWTYDRYGNRLSHNSDHAVPGASRSDYRSQRGLALS